MDYNKTIESVAEDEEYLYTVHKHPFGIVIFYIQAIVGVGGGLALLLFLLPPSTRSQYAVAIAMGAILVCGITALLLLIVTYIYSQNKLIVTDQNLTQVIQRGLFYRQVSELSMASVEDVTADQRGVFATMFGFGELRVETAGEQNNFHFTYCPKANYCGKLILDARQKYINHSPEQAKRANERLNVPGGYQP